MERDEQSLLMSTLKPKLHTERPFLNMFVAASILTARNIYIDAWTLICFIKASGSCKVAACTASLQHSATALFFAKVASSNKNARGFEARCCCQVYRSGACDHQSAIFNDGDSRRRTQSRLHLARLWDGIGKPKLHTERPFLNMFVAASILTARNIYIDAWTLICFIKASGSCKVAACTASLQHSATALFFAKVASSNKNARGFEARCCCQVYRSGACDHQSAITHPFPGH